MRYKCIPQLADDVTLHKVVETISSICIRALKAEIRSFFVAMVAVLQMRNILLPNLWAVL